MTPQEAILKIVSVFDDGNRQMEEVLEVCGGHSLKAGQLLERIEKSMMFRVGEVVRDYEHYSAKESRATARADISQGSTELRNHPSR